MGQVQDVQRTANVWKWLYIVGGVTSMLAVVIFRRNLAVELMQFGGFGLIDMPEEWPTRAIEWFDLLQKRPFVGLILLDMVDLINYGLLGFTFLALYMALREINKSASLMALALSISGIVVYFGSNQATSILTLSNQYAEATSEAQRTMLLAAGEALLAISNYDSSGFATSRFLVTVAGLLFSVVMLRSAAFYKATAYAGILANLLLLSSFIIPAFAPSLNWLAPTLSAPFRVVWMILMAVGFFRLAMNPERGDEPIIVERHL